MGAANPNLVLLALAVQKLAPLLDNIVFVGGCVTALLVTDPTSVPVRPTFDVDAIAEIGSYAELMATEKRLLELGFQRAQGEGSPICRWTIENLIFDLMPTDPSILGFSNRWYGLALSNSQRTRFGEYEIRLIAAPYFLATKLEAFHGRGKSDFQMSHDLEDIVTVIDGRSEIVEEVHFARPDLRTYLRDNLRSLLSERDFLDALPGHLLPDAASQQRLGLILRRMKRLAEEE